MKTSLRGITLIRTHEQCRLVAYQDPKKVWTIGWGHTGPEVVAGLAWTQAKADATLVEDLRNAENCVNSHVTAHLTQGEFDALVSLVFNIGCKNFKGSTLLRLLNDGNYDGAAAEFPHWKYSGGQVLVELVHRRAEERELFESWRV